MRNVILLMSLGLAGCATIYSKPGASTQEFYKAKTTCQVQLNQSGVGQDAGWASGMVKTRYMKECMAGEGWIAQ